MFNSQITRDRLLITAIASRSASTTSNDVWPACPVERQTLHSYERKNFVALSTQHDKLGAAGYFVQSGSEDGGMPMISRPNSNDHDSSDFQQAYRRCVLCEHRCQVNRTAGELGFCKAHSVANVFRHRVEYGEELELVPSHLFYLSGCDLRCGFCIAGIDAFDPSRGTPLTSGYFNAAVEWGIARGAKNVQWVGGEPTIHLPAILHVMSQCPKLPPVVWKSDFLGCITS